jgi:UDP-N-acetylmuramoyl-L-alanyl-D-glutamate--2,6-diaminopimelate ligase
MMAAAHIDPDDAVLDGIAGLTADSRQVRPGWLFAALPGAKADGRAFIADALARGATAVLAPAGTVLPAEAPSGIRLIEDDRPRRRFAQLAAAFYRRQPGTIAAVTGTNGKTSVVNFARQIWSRLGHAAACLGTLGLTAPGRVRTGSLTTPDPVALHADLADLADAGVTHLALEASSHGLDQCRLDGVRVGIAAFTNLGRDHLDYHGDQEAYFAAKARLFDELLPPGGLAVLNADAPEAVRLGARCARRGVRTMTYGRRGLHVRLLEADPLPEGQLLRLYVEQRPRVVLLPLIGTFQAENALCALAIALASGADTHDAIGALTRLAGVRGRLELAARTPQGAPVFVDYAHTPDALSAALAALRPHVKGRLIAVFGCGGDRDRAKRPEMGAVVARLADHGIVTDDNPRSEPPGAIRAAILAAHPEAEEIGDRAEAIRRGVALLGPDDALLIAGKGHEPGQEIAGVVRPFDDAEQARAAAAAPAGGAA